jgi:hypothetical protein
MLYTSMYSRASTKLTRTTNFVHSNEAATRSILYTNEYSSVLVLYLRTCTVLGGIAEFESKKQE